MSTRLLIASSLAALALVVAFAPTVAAKEVTLNVTAEDDQGTDYYFLVEGQSGRNPTISLAPGDEVTVNFRNNGTMVHNLNFGPPIDQKTAILTAGKNATLSFTVPANATGESEYWCDPHKGLDMLGKVSYASAAGNQTGNGDEGDGDEAGGDNRTPFPGALGLAAAGVAAAFVARRRRA